MTSEEQSKLTVAVAEADSDGGQRFIKSLQALDAFQSRLTIIEIAGPVNDGNIGALNDGVDVLSVFVDSKVTKSVLDACPNLKLVATRSTGFDHIDMEQCAKREIGVVTVPHYGSYTVAEHTFALILALSRNIHRAYMRTQRRDFNTEGLQGFDLRGRTIGVVGVGNIGLHVAKMARGFGMRVVASDPKPNDLIAEVIGFDYVSLAELFAMSDIVSLHAPLITSTKGMVNREALSKFKRGALLINTSRGGLVDTDALLWALDNGILGGAGLDVLEGEQLLTDDDWLREGADEGRLRLFAESQQLLQRENVVVTPHMAFDSVEAVQRIADTTAQNIERYFEGSPENLVP